ncbi:MAG: PrsW family intramembrane metalloprotease [Anaerolineae bacterium]|nr:PrsW family intramembrane metalloprotease [Anaerolineae bacterium]
MEFSPGAVVPLSIVAAMIPAALYVALIYSADRYEKEPGWLLAATFFWGAVPSIAIALLFNLLGTMPLYFAAGPDSGGTIAAVLVAPPVEETAKALALIGIFVLMRHEIDGLLDGIIYGAMVGMGFAMVENIFYFIQVYGEGGAEAWRSNVLFRTILFGLNHSLFTSMTGLGLAAGRFSRRRDLRYLFPIAGWSLAVLLHALHNVGASTNGPLCLIMPLSDWGGVWLLLAIIVWALWQEKQWIRHYLAEEVERGTLSQWQYETASSGRARFRYCLTVLFDRGPAAYRDALRFYRHCSELAYKKHHFELLQEAGAEELTGELRTILVELSRRV